MVFLKIDKTIKTPLYKQISSQIRTKILNKEISHLTLLPSEKEFKLIYDISDIVVKRAYKILEEENLVKRVKGSGTFVVNRKVIRLSYQDIDKVIDIKGHDNITNKVLNIQKTTKYDEVTKKLREVSNDIYEITQILVKDDLPICYQNIYVNGRYFDYTLDYLKSELNVFNYIKKHSTRKVRADYSFNAANSNSLYETILDISKDSALYYFKADYYIGNDLVVLVNTVYPGKYFELEAI